MNKENKFSTTVENFFIIIFLQKCKEIVEIENIILQFFFFLTNYIKKYQKIIFFILFLIFFSFSRNLSNQL